MDRHTLHDNATSNVLAWTSHCANVEASAEEETGADADEPPEKPPPCSPITSHFKRGPVRRGSEHNESLLTKALQSHSDEDQEDGYTAKALRRRSITSNFSLASTADLTCDTGITTPARTSTPSPRLPDVGFVSIAASLKKGITIAASPRPLTTIVQSSNGSAPRPKDPAVEALEKKRCISFACAAKPKVDDRVLMPPPPPPKLSTEAPKTETQPAVKRPTISFACPARPSRPASLDRAETSSTPASKKPASFSQELDPAPVQKNRSPSAVRSTRSSSVRRTPQSPTRVRGKKILSANSVDLQSECSRFHEFASDEPQEDDWIVNDDSSSKRKITISDTLEKENAIRKIGKEAEEEAEQEEFEDENEIEEDEEDVDGDVDNGDDDNGDVLDLDDDYSGYGSDDDASDGYNTDNEVGFADSDDEDDDLVLWSTGGMSHHSLLGATPVRRRPSFGADQSDSSAASRAEEILRAKSRGRKPVVFRPGTPELPDSTDFVCGTLDEDRPLEEAYISCIAARKQKKHYPIPQDIDPSFPASEPEDEVDNRYNQDDNGSDEVLFHGELEDLDHDQERIGRRKKTETHSPKRLRSPPPRRLHSPPPKARGRSPKRLSDRPSPRRVRSPLPLQAGQSPQASPVLMGEASAFKALAFRPGLTQTKSLPKSPAMFPHLAKGRRGRTGTLTKQNHIRGAIDIVKGLEQKRQRRREKFNLKYCNRARKEKAQEKRPPPGQGAERMREVALLLMASKNGQGNYVLSV